MIKKLFILLLLAAGGLFFGSAYVSTGKFRDALESKDVKEVDEMVDWPALQASFKEQSREMMKTFLKEQLGSKADTPEFDRQLDARLEMSLPKLNAAFLVNDVKKRPGKPDVKELVIDSRSWSPLRDFKMRFADDPTVMRFRFNGSGWKLVGVEMDPEEAQKVLRAQFGEAMRNAQTGAPKPAVYRR